MVGGNARVNTRWSYVLNHTNEYIIRDQMSPRSLGGDARRVKTRWSYVRNHTNDYLGDHMSLLLLPGERHASKVRTYM